MFMPLFVLGACVSYRPWAMQDQSRPVPTSHEVVDAVHAEACATKLLGIVPLDSGYTLGALADAARGNHDALIMITIDQSFMNALLVTQECHSLDALAVDFAAPSPKARASHSTEADAHAETTGASAEVPETAYKLAQLLYKTIRRKAPTSADQLHADAAAVWRLSKRGVGMGELTAAAERGIEGATPGASLESILEAGLATSAIPNFEEEDEE